MLFQKDEYSCAVAAIQNALRSFGLRISDKRVRAHSSTTPEKGTGEHGIKNALERLEFDSIDIVKETKAAAWKALTESIRDGSPVILLVDRGQHWVAAVGMLGKDRIVVFDSTRTKKNKAENGVHVYKKRQLFNRWNEFQKNISGIIVVQNKKK